MGSYTVCGTKDMHTVQNGWTINVRYEEGDVEEIRVGGNREYGK